MNKKSKFQIFGHGLMLVYCVLCVLPFLLLFIASFTDEATIIRSGYSFWPEKLSLGAYKYLFTEGGQILRGYGNAVLVTAVGTALNVMMTMGLAYMLSRKDFPLSKFANFYVFFTMLFNGGLVPTYIMYTNYLHVKNTYWGLIVPALLVNAFYIMITRTYISGNIPMELLEAAKIDGAGEFRVYGRLILPLSRPIVATVGLFCGLAYWNDWMNGLYYINDNKLYTIQNILNKMINEAQFLANNSEMAGQLSKAALDIPTNTIKMAIAVIGIIPIMIIYPFIQKNFVKGIVLGAVKG